MTKDLQEKATNAAALLGAVAALVVAAEKLWETLKVPGKQIWEHWPWYLAATLILLVIALWRRDRLIRWLAPRSTVTNRAAFQIGRKYLLGREEDVERLLRVLAEWPLVFLVGESGSGKSSLLERGVLPRLREIPGQIPLLVSSWGPDWIEGPREALAQALEPLLDESLRKLLGLEGPVAPGDALKIVGRLRAEAHRSPILLFDQLDDYQTRHREKFLSGPERTLLSAESLAAENPYWREVADLLKAGGIRCLFTTRSDAKIGLESVRFQEPKVYLLDPLERSAAADLLTEIAKEAVDQPERGFERLTERLLGDLAADGWVLPVQMQGAFSGLADLRFLSVGEYEKQGGLPGLEALHLETRISAAARAIGVAVAEVRAVLLAMVDQAARKTVPLPTERLLQIFPGGNSSKLPELLAKLEIDEVIRQPINPGSDGSVWQLDHDYLSRGLLELDRRARRWDLFLTEASCSYQRARGLIDRWKKLLSPSIQVRLIYERLRGRLSYGNSAHFARLSTVRFSIWLIWLSLPLAAFFGWRALSSRQEADRIFAEFGQSVITNGELKALWTLTSESQEVRHAFLDTAFANDANARRFNERGELAIHAGVGFQGENREYLLERIVGYRCIPQNAEQSAMEPSTIKACALAIHEGSASPEDVKKLLRSWVSKPGDVESLVAFGELIKLNKPDPELAQAISLKTFESLQNMKTATSRLVDLLLPRDKRRVVELFLRGLRANENNPQGMLYYGELGDVMTIEERKEVVKRVVLWLETLRDKWVIYTFVCYGVVESEIPAQDVRRVLDTAMRTLSVRALVSVLAGSKSLLMVMKSMDARKILEDYIADTVQNEEAFGPGDDVSRLIEKLESADALALWQIGLKKHDAPLSARALLDLDLVFDGLPARLSSSDARIASQEALMAMRNAGSADFSRLTGVLGKLKEKISTKEAREASTLILARLDDGAKSEKLALMANLGDLEQSLSASVVDEFSLHILMEMRTNRGSFDILATSLSKLAPKMSDRYVHEAARLVAARILNAKDLGYFDVGSTLLDQLKSRLTLEEIRKILEAELSRAEKDPREINRATAVFASFGRLSPVELTELELQRWIDYNRLSGNPICSQVVPLVRNPRDPRVIDLLKWPTCTSESRDFLIARLDDLVGDTSFGSKGPDGKYHADIWRKFVPWAKKQGLDLDSPPKLPDLDKLKVN